MKRRHLQFALIFLVLAISLQFTACGKKDSTDEVDSKPSVSGLTSIEASELAYKTAKNVFEDAVLWRMVPIEDAKSKKLMLDQNWHKNDVSSAWFLWYAENNGENWFLIGIKGKEVSYKSLGTRGFGAIAIESSWPRDRLSVSLKEAASKAVALGVKVEALTWA